MQFQIFVSAIIQYQGGVLFVKEGKNLPRGRLNLPGGHLELGETALDGVKREVMEEAGLQFIPGHVVGVYVHCDKLHGFQFVFSGTCKDCRNPQPGDDILGCEWVPLEGFAFLTDERLHRPDKLRQIIADYKSGRQYPLSLIRELA